MKYTLQEIADICRGKLMPGSVTAPEVEHLLTDSRNVCLGRNSLFFAINTEANDGLRYLPELYAKGVRSFVVDRLPDVDLPEANYILVPSVVKALQVLGAVHRAKMPAKVVAVTGSRGKTVVKEWIYNCLWDSDMKCIPSVRSPRSYNSQIGVPLSLWLIEPEHKVAIIEAGISRSGEMSVLRDIIKPDMVVLTDISDEHAEGFPSFEDKLLEKVSLCRGAKQVVCPADGSLPQAVRETGCAGELITWSRNDRKADLYVESEAPLGDMGYELTYAFRGKQGVMRLRFNEPWMIDDALTALTALLALGCSAQVMKCATGLLGPVATRIDVSDGVNDCLVAYDSFTCDLPSLETALDFINRRADEQGRTRTLVLADQVISPLSAEQYCRGVASLISKAGIKRFIGVGHELCKHAEFFPSGSRLFETQAQLLEHLSTSDFVSEFVLIKGNFQDTLSALRINLEARTHETVLEVNLDAIVKNFNYFRAHLPHSTGLIAMVKASAYGAGSLEVAKTLQAQGAAYLAVAVLDEGIELRKAGITMPIMVMNPMVLNYRAMFAHRLEPEIYSLEMLRDVVREAGKCGITDYPIHLKLDTGMHRMGFNDEEFPALLSILTENRAVKVSTMFSHLATADCLDMDDYTLAQLHRFEAYTTTLMQGLGYRVKRHVLNTAGILRFPEFHYDFARLGIGLYGVPTLPPHIEQLPAVVSTLRTVIIAVKERSAGEAIGYGRRSVLNTPATIATIPIGYADGMNRRFGCGRSRVVVHGKEVPTIGNICMDACMIDVTGVPCSPGDSVEIFGEQMDVQRLADTLETIPYEVLTAISPRVKRIYYRE